MGASAVLWCLMTAFTAFGVFFHVESAQDGETLRDFQAWLDYVAVSSSNIVMTEVKLSSLDSSGSSSRADEQHHDRLSQRILAAERNQTLIVVAQDGSGDFRSVAEAIGAIPEGNSNRVNVFIKAGVYREKIVIPSSKPFVTLQGQGNSLTNISWNATASDRVEINGTTVALTTFKSATVTIKAKNFIARDITFENTAPVASGIPGRQAVALRISGDMGAFYDCRFIGGQDTLYDHKGRHYFKRCFIQGTVDFIFGYGRSLYKECRLSSIANGTGSVTAQKRTVRVLNSGFSFVNCTITGTGRVYLGRAWGDRSRVVYSYTYMEGVVRPEGWQNWNRPERNRTVFYGEYACTGPGADTSRRVPWAKALTYQEAVPFLGKEFIHGGSWLLST